ncbi:P-loop containing nucleoside triphosphate hydrolase protein, partial [Fragilariopsis cylindrus CCMP1102]
IGLVGKPSAGKSTFFNAATGFSRQRGQQQQQHNRTEATTPTATAGSINDASTKEESEILGGASMAAHPFTTIDPNIGYCLIPAPYGSCPEDDFCDDGQSLLSLFGSTHGRDPNGRRFIPVQLKDVAGLVPGAYQGKGRGNQFLNDLTDATVLIHVVDSSGSADSSGNKIIIEEEEKVDGGFINDTACTEVYQRTNPIDDLEWIRSELVEWVYSNLIAKWDIIIRKGRSKLIGMFSGYGQREVMIDTIFNALDKYLDDNQKHDQQIFTPISLDRIDLWSECDIHRLVSLFLGVRFPMALALNKTDLPSAKHFVKSIQDHLP